MNKQLSKALGYVGALWLQGNVLYALAWKYEASGSVIFGASLVFMLIFTKLFEAMEE